MGSWKREPMLISKKAFVVSFKNTIPDLCWGTGKNHERTQDILLVFYEVF